jgi:diguanylate cyclase (GGDEF)-like protein
LRGGGAAADPTPRGKGAGAERAPASGGDRAAAAEPSRRQRLPAEAPREDLRPSDFKDEPTGTYSVSGKPLSSGRDVDAANDVESEERDYLVILTGGQMGQLFGIGEDQLVIGRGASCDVRIGDDGVSRRQAHLMREDGRIFVEDLGSRNGTFVNGKRLEHRHPLSVGDKIQVGTSTLVKYARLDPIDAAYQQRMFEAAVKDALTGALNKRHFQERIEAELAFARRHKTPLALLVMDVDRFRRINQDHGYAVGDKLLQAVARRLRSIVRTEDVLARWSGDDFAILTRVDTAGALALAERIRTQIAANQFAAHAVETRLTVTIGVAAIPDVPAELPRQLVQAADEAMARAKQAGRNRVESAAIRK